MQKHQFQRSVYDHSQIAFTCDDLAKRHRLQFSWIALIGILAFTVYRFVMNDPDVYHTSWAPRFFHVLQLLDDILAPRTIAESSAVASEKGLNYYEILLLHHAAIGIIGIYLVIISLYKSKYSIQVGAKTMTAKKFSGLFVIFVFSIIFRPPDFHSNSLALNIIDNNGIYFFRESIVMALGYFSLYGVALNVWASIRSR